MMSFDSSRRTGACRVLVMAPNWLGDAVMTTPLLTMLSQVGKLYNGRKLEVVLGIRRRWAPLFLGDPRISELIMIKRNGCHGGVAGAFRLGHFLRRSKFDAVVLGPPSFRAGLVGSLAGIPIRVGYKGDGRSLLLTDSLKPALRGNLHYSRELILLGEKVLEALGNPTSRSAVDRSHPIPLPSLPGCNNISPVRNANGPPIWVFAPGVTYGAAKTWPGNRAAEFLKLAVQQDQVRVVLLGDANSCGIAASLKKDTGLPWRTDLAGPAGVIDLTGQTNLLEAVAILRAASVFVGNDSGLMHVSAALGLVTIGIFGSSSPKWTAPGGKLTEVVVADGFDCRPCFRRTCNQAKFCLDSIGGQEVYQRVHDLLNNAPKEV